MSIQAEINRIVGEVTTQEELMEEILTTLAEKSANTGGSAKEEQEKTIDITENGTTEVLPDSGKVLSKVTVNVAVEASSNGESINPLEYATFNSGRVFFGSQFPDNTEIKIKFNHATPNIKNQFNYTNAKSFTIDLSNVTSCACDSIFNGSRKCTDITLIGNTEKVTSYFGMFQDCVMLESIIGDLNFINDTNTNSYNTFSKCYELENVRFVEKTVLKTIWLADCSLLSDDSIQSIIDGLADLTGQTTQTLTLHANVKAKVTDAQLTAITSKNWTLA